jgi:hypothetical protein
VPPPVKYEAPCDFEVGLWGGTFILWGLLIVAGRHGYPIYTVCVILTYTIVMVAIILAENRGLHQATGYKVRSHFDPGRQSWAYMFGDTIALPFAGFFAAIVWQSMPPGWFGGLGWLVVSAAAGATASAAFHASEVRTYRKLAFDQEIYSRSKRWHDFATYFGLFGGLGVYLCWPLVWGVLFRHVAPQEVLNVWLMIAGLAAWLVLAICDAVWRKPSPGFMHPPGEGW